MIKSHFTIAWRNLLRNKTTSLINISGLATGMAVVLMIGLWIYDEISFDHSFENHGSIAQVMQNVNFDGNISTTTVAPIPLGIRLRQDYKKDLQYVVLSTFTEKHTLVVGQNKLNSKGNYMQSEAPEMLSLQMLKGSRKSLDDPSSILLSASLAHSLFGSAEPMGQTIRIDNRLNVEVAGVYQDIPANTSFKEMAFIASWDLYMTTLSKDASTFWMNNSWQIFVQLSSHADIAGISGSIKNIVMENIPPPPPGQSDAVFSVSLFLHPMDKWHLYSEFKNGVNTGGRIEFVWMFGIIGIFILLLGCVNFMNLSTARSEKRAKEVGIRKTLGSQKKGLVGQFFTESLLVTFLSFLITLLLVQLCLPFFNQLADKQMAVPWKNLFFWLSGLVFCLITGIIAGSYPAFYLSSFDPIKVLKGTFRAGRFAALPRKLLMVLQFSVSVILIVATIIVFRQVQFTKDRPVGYTPGGLLQWEMKIPAIHQHFDAIRNELIAASVITDMAESGSPLTDLRANYGGLEWNGKDPNMHDNFGYVPVSSTFGKTSNWKLIDGRDFTDSPADSTAMILNEAAVAYMGLKRPVGETIRWGGNYKVIGVIKNMLMTSPYEPVKPTVFCRLNRMGDILNIRLNPTVSTHQAIAKISTILKQYDPESPFDYQFTDTEYAKKFGDEERIGKLAAVFSIFAIFICCLGLFGMASFMAEQRIKEVAVRKVLGASVFGLWRLLSTDLLMLVLISIFIAVPVSWYFMHHWLQNYSYRTELSWGIFGLAAASALLITLITISYQSITTALTNPVKSLRTE